MIRVEFDDNQLVNLVNFTVVSYPINTMLGF